MKILFLLTQDLESPGGLGRYGPLAKELVHLGHTITIAALHPNFSALPCKRFIKDGVDIWYVAPMHVRKRGNIKSYYSTPKLLWILLRATFALSWAALTTPVDIIHIGKPHPMNGLAGLLGKIIRGKRTYLDCDDFESDVNRFSANWQKKAMNFFERWLPRQVNHITTHNSHIISRLQEIGIPQERISYLSNGVDRSRFAMPDPMKAEAVRKELGLGGKSVVAYIGSLSLVGHPVNLLLNAFVTIRQVRPDCVLLLVGGGEDYEKLQSQTQALGLDTAVIFRGHVDPKEINLYYSLANVSVDPVYDDSAARGRSPLKLFESWACGVPFVSADVGDRNRLLGDPPAGLLAIPGDPSSMADKILQIINDQNLAQVLCNRGLERVEAYYWDRLAVELDKLYNRWYTTPH